MIPSSIIYTLPYSPLRIDSSSNLMPTIIIIAATITIIGRTSGMMLGFTAYAPIIMRFSLENMFEASIPMMSPIMLDAMDNDMIAEESMRINFFFDAPRDLRIISSLEWVEAIKVDVK